MLAVYWGEFKGFSFYTLKKTIEASKNQIKISEALWIASSNISYLLDNQ